MRFLRKADQDQYFSGSSLCGKVIYLDQAKDGDPNAAVVRLVCRHLECRDEETERVLRNFEGLEHRLEEVGRSNEIVYVNDSKSTTPASLSWALEKYHDKRVILIAGGRPKSSSFGGCRGLVERAVKKAILIGEARPLLLLEWRGACDLFETNELRLAVAEAHRNAVRGDTILFSPGCSSFDMFKNYDQRGRAFKKLVRDMFAVGHRDRKQVDREVLKS